MEYHTFNNFLDDSSQLLGFGHIYEVGSPPSHWVANAKDVKLSHKPKHSVVQPHEISKKKYDANQYSGYELENGSDVSESAPSLYSRNTYESELSGSSDETSSGYCPQSFSFDKYDVNSPTYCETHQIQDTPSLPVEYESDSANSPQVSSPKSLGNFSIFSDSEYATNDYVASLYERDNASSESSESDSACSQPMGYYLQGSPIIRNPSPWYATDNFTTMPQNVGISPNSEPQLRDLLNREELVYNTDIDSSPEYSPTSNCLVQSKDPSSGQPSIDTTTTTNKPRSKRRVKHCPICNKALLRDLTRHIRTHSKEAGIWCPFPRELCNHKRGTFNRRYEYKKHLITAHFECDDNQAAREATWLNDKLNLSGTCRCGQRFSCVKYWISDHIENRRCPLLTNPAGNFDHHQNKPFATM